MKLVNRKPIKITNLLLSLENPRFDPVGHQREALDAMIHTKALQEKTKNLARDIEDAGTNPAELIIVISVGNGKYKVLEGNRRIAALKFLSNPELFKDKYKSFTKYMKTLATQYRKNPIKEVLCAIFDDASAANRWIKLRHTGENKGRGIVSWDAQQVARFDAMVAKKSSVGLQAIDFIKDFADELLVAKIKKMSITNLERLLTDKNIQDVLGIRINNGILETNLLREEAKKGLVKIIRDVAEKKVKVKDIYTKEDRKKYIETFDPASDIPDNKKVAENAWKLTVPESQYKISFGKKGKAIPLSTRRSSVIPRNCILTIKNAPRINKIYTELKDLNIDDLENAGAVLFRVFIELSVNKFIAKYKLLTHSSKGKALFLRQKLNNVENYMQQNGMATKEELKGIRIMAKGKDTIYSVDTFNDYVHNLNYSPSSKDLKTSWDNIQGFVEKMWGNI